MPQPRLQPARDTPQPPSAQSSHPLQSKPFIPPGFNMTDDPTLNALRAALDSYVDPYLGESLGAAQAVQELTATPAAVSARIRLGFPIGGYRDELTVALKNHLARSGINTPLIIELIADIRSHAVQRNLKPIEQIKNVVAVASGKGGVGKSTVAVNLALAWATQGARVGLLDADIYGPSQPLMLGLEGQRPSAPDGKHLQPVQARGIGAMSSGVR